MRMGEMRNRGGGMSGAGGGGNESEAEEAEDSGWRGKRNPEMAPHELSVKVPSP